jgi:hypothetical protein
MTKEEVEKFLQGTKPGDVFQHKHFEDDNDPVYLVVVEGEGKHFVALYKTSFAYWPTCDNKLGGFSPASADQLEYQFNLTDVVRGEDHA